MMDLYLPQVLFGSVLMDLRNGATHFALFTTIGVTMTTIKWQLEQSAFLDIPPQYLIPSIISHFA